MTLKLCFTFKNTGIVLKIIGSIGKNPTFKFNFMNKEKHSYSQ